MKLNFGWKSAALALSSFAMTISFSACGSSDQSNPPLVPADEAGAVELISSSLQYNETRTLITGAITTQYTDPLTGTATLSGVTFSVPGCSVSSASSDVITYNDGNEVTTPITIGLTAECQATALTINATETSDLNATLAWSRSASIADPIPGAITSPIAFIVPDTATQNIELTQNNEPREIVLKVYDINGVPLSSGTISIKYPSEGVTGVDIGTMNPVDKVTVADGVARFTYVGPSDLITLINSGYSNAVWTFFDTLNPVKTVDVTVSYNPDTSVPPPVLTGYTVSFVSSNLAATTNLESTSVFTLSVKDDDGNLIPNENLTSSYIESLQPSLVKFIDENGTEKPDQQFYNKNNIAMTIQTYRKSGLVPFSIVIKIKDVNGNISDKNVTKSITVFSGPPTAMSISYAGTAQDEDNAKFIEKMVLSLTDTWGNPVNTEPTIYAGGTVGYATETGSLIGNHYLIRPLGHVTIGTDVAGAKMTADASGTIDFSQVDVDNDILMTFGAGYTYQASGKWDVDQLLDADNITMSDAYTAQNPVSGLGFTIGHNYRQDLCSFSGRELVGQIDSADGDYVVDSTGNVIIDFRYDYELTGKTVTFGASVVGTFNATDEVLRMGEAVTHTLRGHGFSDAGITVPQGFDNNVTFSSFGLNDAPAYLTDAGFHFGIVESTGDVIATYQASSNDINPATGIRRIYDCVDDLGHDTNGRSWVRYHLVSVEGGTFTLSDGLVVPEF